MTPELPVLAAKLRRLREHIGMSRPAFAKLLNLNAISIKNWELGYRDVAGELIVSVANTPETAQLTNYLLLNEVPVDHLEKDKTEGLPASTACGLNLP